MAAAAQEGGGAAVKKGGPGQPWTHTETMHLIDAYEERWTKLRRGQLKAHQWEDVAAEVARRCTASGAPPRKNGTQCRHKMEKLRKRYRNECARPVTSLWPYFRRMDRLERGPLPVNTFPPSAASPAAAASDEDGDEEEEEEEEDEEEEVEGEDEEEEELLLPRNNTRSINGLLRESRGFGGAFAPRQAQPQKQQQPSPPLPPPMTLSTAPPRKRVTYEAFHAKPVADRVNQEETPVHRPSGVAATSQFAAVLKDIGEGIMRLERRRMEVQWEIERQSKEAEARHHKMFMEAQLKLSETIAVAAAAAGGLAPAAKKAKRDHSNGGDGL